LQTVPLQIRSSSLAVEMRLGMQNREPMQRRVLNGSAAIPPSAPFDDSVTAVTLQLRNPR
jgi:hypothetical protein